MRKSKSDRKRFVPRVEALEARDVPTVLYWIGNDQTPGGDPHGWDDRLNWSTSPGGARNAMAAPGVFDDVVFDGGAQAICIFDPSGASAKVEKLSAVTDSAGSFSSSGEILEIQANKTLEVTGDTTSTHDAGSWDYGSASLSMSMQGGTLWLGGGTWTYKRGKVTNGGATNNGLIDIHTDTGLGSNYSIPNLDMISQGNTYNVWDLINVQVGSSGSTSDGVFTFDRNASEDLEVDQNWDVYANMDMYAKGYDLLTYGTNFTPPIMTIHKKGNLTRDDGQNGTSTEVQMFVYMYGAMYIKDDCKLNVTAVNGTGNKEQQGSSMIMDNEQVGQTPPSELDIYDGSELLVHDEFLMIAGNLHTLNGSYGDKAELGTNDFDFRGGIISIGNDGLPDTFQIAGGTMEWGDTNSAGTAKVVIGWDASNSGTCSNLIVDLKLTVWSYSAGPPAKGAVFEFDEVNSMPVGPATHTYSVVTCGTISNGGNENKVPVDNPNDNNLLSVGLGTTDQTTTWTLTATS